jgi:hypothetical protein
MIIITAIYTYKKIIKRMRMRSPFVVGRQRIPWGKRKEGPKGAPKKVARTSMMLVKTAMGKLKRHPASKRVAKNWIKKTVYAPMYNLSHPNHPRTGMEERKKAIPRDFS